WGGKEGSGGTGELGGRRDINGSLAGEVKAGQKKPTGAVGETAGAAPSADAALPIKPFRGDLDWPVSGAVRTRFGKANGIEVGGAAGEPVSAVHDGAVAFAGTFAGFGNLVILDHGSQAYSLYGDLLEVSVARGARVDRGQPVGSLGPLPTGGAGVYFELRIDGRPVDPLQWLRKR